jgi:hypothetical protein
MPAVLPQINGTVEHKGFAYDTDHAVVLAADVDPEECVVWDLIVYELDKRPR